MKKLSILLALLLAIALPITAFGESDDRSITRAEFLKQILIAKNAEIQEISESSFVDVTNPDYIPYIEAAYKRGIISGYGENLNPNKNLTKEEAVVILVKAFGQKKNLIQKDKSATYEELQFSDISSISPWAKPYIAYALEKEIIEDENTSFYPKMILREEKASKMIDKAKATYEKNFTREGLSASDMLVMANEKNSQFNTYKQKGLMAMNMNMKIEGVSQSEIEKDIQLQNMLNQGMDMSIEMEIQAQNPDKAYIKEIIKSNIPGQEEDQTIEIFMDSSAMYTKMMGNEKWIKQDISGVMKQLKGLSNNDPHSMSKISKQQLELYKDYASFDEDKKVNSKEYYVVNVDLDKDTYKRIFEDMIDKTINGILEAEAQKNNESIEQDNLELDTMKEMMSQIMNQMEIEISYKFYINKYTKDYELMDIVQDVYMPMDNIIKTMQSYSEEEVNQDIHMEMITHMEGQFEIYDFNKEVSFPQIGPDDIINPFQTIEE